MTSLYTDDMNKDDQTGDLTRPFISEALMYFSILHFANGLLFKMMLIKKSKHDNAWLYFLKSICL